ncbi:MAG TPA: hypothetical protein HA319_04045 [Nitrosopumilaceae archaeon]|nr:hypothetical protein [Nitrosopumilaceae archaeon]
MRPCNPFLHHKILFYVPPSTNNNSIAKYENKRPNVIKNLKELIDLLGIRRQETRQPGMSFGGFRIP